MFLERLIDRPVKSGKPPMRHVQWISLESMGVRTGSGSDVLGVMEIIIRTGPRAKVQTCRYVVSEVATRWDGRGFHLAKPEGEEGSDQEAESYDVFVCRNNQNHRCECKGFLHHSHCKHLDSLMALITNGRLDAETPCPVNQDADVASLEVPW